MRITVRSKRIIILLGFIAVILIHFNWNTLKETNNQSESSYFEKDASLSDFVWNNTIFINNGADEGRDLVLDSFGNIFVTGKIKNSSKNAYDTILIKYNSSGDMEWNKTWGGSSDDAGLAIDIDSSNNIYVAGWTKSFGVNNSNDISLLKFDNNGVLDWNRTWGGDQKDTGHGIVVDSDYIYVAGFTKINLNYGDAVILKYHNSGSLMWNRTWGESSIIEASDGAYDVDVDLAGNVYITGYSESYGAVSRDLFLAKYNSSGNLLDNVTWGDDNWNDISSLSIGSDSIYVVGNRKPNITAVNNIILTKFDLSSFSPQWTTTWGGNENNFGYDIALDSNNNVYIVGSIENVDITRACIVKFNSSGDFQWYKTYSNGIEDIGLGIKIDSSNCQYVTGKTMMLDTDFDIFLLKEFPIPTSFKLATDADSYDTDGAFNLSWTESYDADNYSLYQYDKEITKINGSIEEIVSGNTNRTYLITNLDRGTYYYKVVAFNQYGNYSSNSISVVVQFPPDSFNLIQPDPMIDTDGIIFLSWSNSIGALNYSIYVNTVYIDNFNNKGNLIQEGLTNTSSLVAEDLVDGDYYFVIVAINEVGQTMSNCINIIVQKHPTSFTLTKEIDTETVDENGEFFLSWTQSKFANYYIIYNSTTPMNDTDSSIQELYTYVPDFVWPEYRHKISVSENGSYYYQVTAFNEYGNYTSNFIEVQVAISGPVHVPGGPDLWFILILIFIISGILAGLAVSFYFYRRYKKKKEKKKVRRVEYR